MHPAAATVEFLPQYLFDKGKIQKMCIRDSSGAVLLDVRTPEEYRDGHLPGAKNLPLDRLDTIAEPSGSPLFVYCRSGARSAQARARLARAGYSVTDLGGLLGYRGPLEA